MGESSHRIISTAGRRRVAIIGAGNVAWHLAAAVASCHDLVAVYSRSLESAVALEKNITRLGHLVGQVGSVSQASSFADADIYIISVSDGALDEVVDIVGKKYHNCGTLFLHTSGSMPMDILSPLSDNYGVLYPLQTFTKSAGLDFSKVPLLIEANTEANSDRLQAFASSISDLVQYADSEQRRKIHIAAVFACNFANALWDIAYKRLAQDNIPFSVLMPLLENSLAKLSHMTPAQAQTGPASRGDMNLIQSHLSSLSGSEKEIYSLISDYIISQKTNKDC